MADQYSLEIASKVVCQLAESSGFGDGIQRSALDTLAELLVRYIAQAASGAAGFAELAGRTEVTPIDLVPPSVRSASALACAMHTLCRTYMMHVQYFTLRLASYAAAVVVYAKHALCMPRLTGHLC